LLRLVGWEVIRTWPEILWRWPRPGVAPILNKFVGKTWPVPPAGPHEFHRGPSASQTLRDEPSLSIVVPAEKTRLAIIKEIFDANAGHGTLDGAGVRRGTFDRTHLEHDRTRDGGPPWRRAQMHRQGGRKGRCRPFGFAQGVREILMILDADLTVPPEDLPRFYEALRTGRRTSSTGAPRLSIEDQAMRFHEPRRQQVFQPGVFLAAGQPSRTRCVGPRPVSKADYELIAANRSHFGDFDPFG